MALAYAVFRCAAISWWAAPAPVARARMCARSHREHSPDDPGRDAGPGCGGAQGEGDEGPDHQIALVGPHGVAPRRGARRQPRLVVLAHLSASHRPDGAGPL